jgi:biopolymer transport protein ExbD
MVVGGLFILALAGWFYLRVSQAERVATVVHEQAVMAEQAAEAARAQADQARQLAAEGKAEIKDKSVPGPQVTIELDQNGKLKLNGHSIETVALLDRLKAVDADKTASITIDVRADEECQFQYVAGLISACQELGITRFRFGTLDTAIAEEPSDEEEPATVVK